MAMKESLRPGVSRVSRFEVDRDRTIGFMGEEGRVYGTPYLVRDIEQTCRQLLLDHGDAGEDSVGTDIAIKHLAPTLLGMSVEITVSVTTVEGRRVVFEISAKDVSW
jgi:predicted thioesterase